MSRRRIPPTSRGGTCSLFQPSNLPLNNELNEPVIPKHIAFCFTQGENEIFSEFIIFVFTLIAAMSQFIHLYRSVWWHEESYNNYSMVIDVEFIQRLIKILSQLSFQNFYLIDKSLVVFIFVMSGRRFFYCLLLKALSYACPDKYYHMAERALKYMFLGVLESIFLICNIKIFYSQNYNIMNILYLIYP